MDISLSNFKKGEEKVRRRTGVNRILEMKVCWNTICTSTLGEADKQIAKVRSVKDRAVSGGGKQRNWAA